MRGKQVPLPAPPTLFWEPAGQHHQHQRARAEEDDEDDVPPPTQPTAGRVPFGALLLLQTRGM